MRIGALLRRRDMAALGAWYARIGGELHEDGGRPHDPDVARRLLGELGLGAETLEAALDDAGTHDDVRADHQRVVDAAGFGVPTLFFFADGQCLFGPVLIDPPAGERALRLWELVTGALEFPHLYEIQRPKGKADRRAIAEALRPYLAGRDRVSIDRGRVIEFPDATSGTEAATRKGGTA